MSDTKMRTNEISNTLETVEDLTKRKATRRNLAKKVDDEDQAKEEGEEDKYEEEEASPSKFATVYSDTDRKSVV